MKYAKVNNNNGRLKSIEIYEGESIETKCARILQNNEPITDGAPIIFTEKKDGVLPEYNIRTDRWDIALDAMNKMETAVGKTVAWINYMTNINRTFGNFAINDNEAFMVLNRNYELYPAAETNEPKITDLS